MKLCNNFSIYYMTGIAQREGISQLAAKAGVLNPCELKYRWLQAMPENEPGYHRSQRNCNGRTHRHEGLVAQECQGYCATPACQSFLKPALGGVLSVPFCNQVAAGEMMPRATYRLDLVIRILKAYCKIAILTSDFQFTTAWRVNTGCSLQTV